MKLITLGWSDFFESTFAPYREKGLTPGRIAVQHRDRYVIMGEDGDLPGQVSGKFRYETAGIHEFPAVGDWVVHEGGSADSPAVIQRVLPRKNKFSRKIAGDRPDEQVIAANIDIVCLVMGLDAGYNLRRLERYLTVAWESGARPVVVLNKSDLCPDAEEKTREARAVSSGADMIVMCARKPESVAPHF